MPELFINPSFEDGHYHVEEIRELQCPNGWIFSFLPASCPNPYDSHEHSRFVRPEMRVLSKTDLPEDEQNLFVLDGTHTLKIFKGNGAWSGILGQSVYFSEPGLYVFTAQIYADLIKRMDGSQKIWADDPAGRDGLYCFWNSKHPDMHSGWRSLIPGEWTICEFEFAVAEPEELTVGIEFMCPFPLHNSGIFADAWSLELEETEDARRNREYAGFLDFSISAGARLPALYRYGWTTALDAELAEYGYTIVELEDEDTE